MGGSSRKKQFSIKGAKAMGGPTAKYREMGGELFHEFTGKPVKRWWFVR